MEQFGARVITFAGEDVMGAFPRRSYLGQNGHGAQLLQHFGCRGLGCGVPTANQAALAGPGALNRFANASTVSRMASNFGGSP